MGSPEPPNNSTAAASIIIASNSQHQQSQSSAASIIDSPIFSYINNLSPIKPVKGTSTSQVFPGFSSPPLIYVLKQIHTHQGSIESKSSECHISSREDKNTTGPNLEDSSSKNFEDVLIKMTDSVKPQGSMETFDIGDDNVLASPTLVDQAHEDHALSCPKPVENNGRNRSGLQSTVCQNLTSVDEQHNQPLVAQVGQSQLGKRRRLQFEAPPDNFIDNDLRSPNPSNTGAISEVLESSLSRTTRGSSANVSKPSGIGLHLNSIVNAKSLRYQSGGGKTLISISSQMQDNIHCLSVSSNSNLVENVSAISEEYAHQTPSSNEEPKKVVEYQQKLDQGTLNAEQIERVDAYVRSNPKKRRKKNKSSDDGCKYCNCKKTKCLKLYCDCFAAGIYCAGSCSCQGCFNRPEYESTVLETRQQIESRDPLAFAPKIIAHSKKPPRSQMLEDGDQATPISVRHKRGCNCKKSMCMKKYCECYQANVGCSEGCRCEGCQNTYGIKGVSSLVREIVNENVSDSFDDKKLKMVSIRSRSSLPEFHKPPNLSPRTPSFQCSTHGNADSEAHAFPGRYAPSPESEYVTTTPNSPNDSSSFGMMTEASNKTNKMDQESYPNVEYMDEFSPGDWSSTSRTQLLPPNRMKFSSLGFHGSSVTPVTLFGGSKPPFNITDDDTPNILKDSSIQQFGKVKVASSSPNKKRVSPPRIRLHELGSNTLKSGRKFILKAVSSFPPLTPCIDSKQTTNDPPPDNTI